MVVEIQMREII